MNKLPDRYIFQAVFTRDAEGMWDAEFPDIPNCFTSAGSLEEAIDAAKYALEDVIYYMEKDKLPIPAPAASTSLNVPHDAICQLVVAHMPPVRRAWSQKAVKKTLTIPAYLAELAEEKDINYSALLQDALRRTLQVQ